MTPAQWRETRRLFWTHHRDLVVYGLLGGSIGLFFAYVAAVGLGLLPAYGGLS